MEARTLPCTDAKWVSTVPWLPSKEERLTHHEDDHYSDGDSWYCDDTVSYFGPEDLQGQTFLLQPREDGHRFTAYITNYEEEDNTSRVGSIVRFVKARDVDLVKNPLGGKYTCRIIHHDYYDEALSLHEIQEHLSYDKMHKGDPATNITTTTWRPVSAENGEQLRMPFLTVPLEPTLTTPIPAFKGCLKSPTIYNCRYNWYAPPFCDANGYFPTHPDYRSGKKDENGYFPNHPDYRSGKKN